MVLLRITQTRRGFTLLHLVMSCALLGLGATCVVNTCGDMDRQFRFEETRRRLGQIRAACVGSSLPGNGPNQRYEPHGFVADVGRLPESVAELLDPGQLPRWHFDADARQWSGWRGPYLPSQFDNGGHRSFSDGWQYRDAVDPNFGWKFDFEHQQGWLRVGSFGSDRKPGGRGFAADFPAEDERLIDRHDHHANLRGWQVDVTFENHTGVDLPQRRQSFRVLVHYPVDGRLNWQRRWPQDVTRRDRAPYLSQSVQLDPAIIHAGEDFTVTVPFGDHGDKFVPCGNRTLVLVDDETGDVLFGRSRPVPVTVTPHVQLRPGSIRWSPGDNHELPQQSQRVDQQTVAGR